ncbi:hypothetical protein [Microbulbifer zhoushanensis]|uniref:hypothetical protein n=1 Tax=Microbulbifer zhoushanensis TaxID=2904254 RepID=UPI001F15F3A0|nr:hypothetical protein [Microbulbifer zhoushanensis]
MSDFSSVEKVTDYVKVLQNPNSNDVVLAFSGVNNPPGRFQYYKQLQSVGANVILMNSSRESYYQFGIDGVGELSDSIEFLSDIVAKLRKADGKVTTFGCSMGGYGALLYGAFLGADNVISLSPSGPRYCASIYSADCHAKNIERFYELKDKIMLSPAKKKVLYGDEIIHDHLSYLEFAGLNNSCVLMFEGVKHAVVQPLIIHYGARRLVSASNIEFFTNTFLPEQDKHFQFLSEFIRLIYSPYSTSALDEFERAWAANIRDSDSYIYTLSSCYLNIGDVDRASKILSSSLSGGAKSSVKLFSMLEAVFDRIESGILIDFIKESWLALEDDYRVTPPDKMAIRRSIFRILKSVAPEVLRQSGFLSQAGVPVELLEGRA